MKLIIELLLKFVLGWIKAHPDAAFSKFMLKQRGPRTDVPSMPRLQRLSSALLFLLWGAFFLALWFLTAWLVFGLHLVSENNPAVQFLLFGLTFATGIGLLGGLYLLLRIIR